MIDYLIVLVPSMLVSAIVLVAFGHSPGAMFDMDPVAAAQRQAASNISSLLQIGIAATYWTWFTVAKGGTLGKLALGLRVVGQDCNYVSWGQGIGRYFATILSCCLVGVGYIMVGFTERKQGLHDMICKTWVVRKEFSPQAQQQR